MSYESRTLFPYTTDVYQIDLLQLILSIVPRKICVSKFANFMKQFILINGRRIATFTFCTFGLYIVYATLRLYPPWRNRLKCASRPQETCSSLQHHLYWAPRPKGIPNLGNTCYMNSILQVFCWTPGLGQKLQDQLRSMKQREKTTKETQGSYFRQLFNMLRFNRNIELEKSMTEALLDLVCEVHGGGKNEVDIVSRKLPEAILNRARNVNQQFEGHQQQDSFEMFNTIVSAIEDEMLLVQPLSLELESSQSETVQIMNTCPVSHLYVGVFITVYSYDSCDHRDVVNQRFTSICVPVIALSKDCKEMEKEKFEEVSNSKQGNDSRKNTTLTEPLKVDNYEKDNQTQYQKRDDWDSSDSLRLENFHQNIVPNLTQDVRDMNCESFEKKSDNEETEINCSPSNSRNAPNIEDTENESNSFNWYITESDNDESLKLTNIKNHELKPFDWKNEGPKTSKNENKNLTEIDSLKFDSNQETEVLGGAMFIDESVVTPLDGQFGTDHPQISSNLFVNSFKDTSEGIMNKKSSRNTEKEGKFNNVLKPSNNSKIHRLIADCDDEPQIATQQYTEDEFEKEEFISEYVNVFPSNNGNDEGDKSLTIVQQKPFLRSSSVSSEEDDVSITEVESLQNKNCNDQPISLSEFDSSQEQDNQNISMSGQNINVTQKADIADKTLSTSEHDSDNQLCNTEPDTIAIDINATEASSVGNSCAGEFNNSIKISSNSEQKSVSGDKTQGWDNDSNNTTVKHTETPETVVPTAAERHEIHIADISNTTSSNNVQEEVVSPTFGTCSYTDSSHLEQIVVIKDNTNKSASGDNTQELVHNIEEKLSQPPETIADRHGIDFSDDSNTNSWKKLEKDMKEEVVPTIGTYSNTGLDLSHLEQIVVMKDNTTKSASEGETQEKDYGSEKPMAKNTETPEINGNTFAEKHKITVLGNSNTNSSDNLQEDMIKNVTATVGTFSNTDRIENAKELAIENDSTNNSRFTNLRKPFQTLKEPGNLKTTLEEGLAEQVNVEYFSEEDLGCIKCSEEGQPVGKGLVHKRLLVVKAPAVLVLQINRFRQTFYGTLEKIQGQVSFPKMLDLSSYCSVALRCDDNEKNTDEVMYHLYGVVAHNGTIERGHYYSYVRTNKLQSSELHFNRFLKPEVDSDNVEKFLKGEPLNTDTRGDKSEDKWFYVTDSFVSETTEDCVFNDPNACILMYERMK